MLSDCDHLADFYNFIAPNMSASGGATAAAAAAARFIPYSPSQSAPHSPHLSGFRSSSSSSSILVVEQEKYLAELLAERNNLNPFMPVLPHTYRLLSQEILRVTTLLGNASVLGQSGLEHASPQPSGGVFTNGGADSNVWASHFQSEDADTMNIDLKAVNLGLPGNLKFCAFFLKYYPSFYRSIITQLDVLSRTNKSVEISGLIQPTSTQNWLTSQGGSSGLIVKRTIRVDIPVDKYPNYNFVGRLLGPRGNSLKRVEASTECRVLIRGRGSIKDPSREEMMRGKPGYEHLNEPLHILVEAELPVEIVDARLMQAREILEDLLRPMDESQDFYKKHQLRELAILNGTLREEGSPMSGSLSPFHNSLGMKRAKTRG